MSNEMVMTEKQQRANDKLLGAMRRCGELAEQAKVEGDEEERRVWEGRRHAVAEAWIAWLAAEGLYTEEEADA
jgi:hypothetical protein